MVILALIVGLSVGALGVYAVVRPALVDRRRRADEVVELRGRLADTTARLETAEAGAGERMVSAFKEMSAEALRENSAAFTRQAIGEFDQYVKPLKESLDKVEKSSQTLEERRQRDNGELHKELDLLRQSSEGLRTQAGNLVTALRAPHVRGRWGEVQLRRVIELAGMVEHCDFDEQQTTTDADGNVLRPDVVVHLPGRKHVVIDSKVPLVAYLDAFRDEITDQERRSFLADHARHVREHIQKLSQKAYWRQLSGTPELVVMFLPDETFMRAALEQDSSLEELAWSNNVVPASPTNLIGLLRAMHYGWNQETIAESAREVSELGRELYKRLATMGAHFSKLGKSLDGAVTAYNNTVGSLEHSVLPQARRFERHGILGIEPPELQPIERQARALAAAELVDADQSAIEVVAAGADAA
jgi:DNA recombination protein RmuC